MKSALTNWRYYAIAAIAAVMMAGLFAEPTDNLSCGDWTIAFVASKMVGIAAGYSLYRMATRWMKQGNTPEISNLIKEE